MAGAGRQMELASSVPAWRCCHMGQPCSPDGIIFSFKVTRSHGQSYSMHTANQSALTTDCLPFSAAAGLLRGRRRRRPAHCLTPGGRGGLASRQTAAPNCRCRPCPGAQQCPPTRSLAWCCGWQRKRGRASGAAASPAAASGHRRWLGAGEGAPRRAGLCPARIRRRGRGVRATRGRARRSTAEMSSALGRREGKGRALPRMPASA